jgi:threonine aldolase
MRILDFRSDTLTQPTAAMRKAMTDALVGDDVYGEDPSVRALEEAACEQLGFESALFMPSGTMTNQIALMLHIKRGQEVIAPRGAHIYEYEPGSLAVLAGGTVRLIEAPGGVPNLVDLRSAIHTSVYQAPTGLIVLENTHNYAGGTVVPLEIQHQVQQIALESGLPTHLDGARLFNAAQALGVAPAAVAKGFTTVSICLSKGLGAPVGSLLLMPKDLRKEAWRYRKMLGGGMRQAGVLAAAALIALEEGPKHLLRDHQMAQRLAVGLQVLGLQVDLASVQTNMVYVHSAQAGAWALLLQQQGIQANAMGGRVRFVTHRDLQDQDIDACLERLQQLS